jgi:hypothetical protein
MEPPCTGLAREESDGAEKGAHVRVAVVVLGRGAVDGRRDMVDEAGAHVERDDKRTK